MTDTANATLVDKIKPAACAATKTADTVLFPAMQLLLRVWMANIFFKAGLTKLNDWESTLFLFEYEYQVPILPVELAAFGATAVELVAPVLLVLGLFTRLAALPMLVMAFVIQFTLPEAYQHDQHYYWMIFLGLLIAKGAGTFSADHFLVKKFGGHN
ncbi:DoxX family protein [Kiloniella sp. b19]|uniref:DoxX family protein n=1 Tax=Kiloniella sp. GXU_MW_B19 TaxID=3141326 RepID=UPI0031DF0DAB